MEAKVITLLNKLARKDSLTGLDVWYKKVLTDIPYKIEKVSAMENNQVQIGQSYSILFPFNDSYMDYDEWKFLPDVGYTLSQGDIIIVGKAIEEVVTPNNIAQIRNKYGQAVCEIKSIIEVIDRGINKYQFKVDGV